MTLTFRWPRRSFHSCFDRSRTRQLLSHLLNREGSSFRRPFKVLERFLHIDGNGDLLMSYTALVRTINTFSLSQSYRILTVGFTLLDNGTFC